MTKPMEQKFQATTYTVHGENWESRELNDRCTDKR